MEASAEAQTGLLLLIEDDDSARASLASLLRTVGFSVVSVAQFREALRELRAAIAPNAILVNESSSGREAGVFRDAHSRDEQLVDIPIITFSTTSGSKDAAVRLEHLVRRIRRRLGARASQ